MSSVADHFSKKRGKVKKISFINIPKEATKRIEDRPCRWRVERMEYFIQAENPLQVSSKLLSI